MKVILASTAFLVAASLTSGVYAHSPNAGEPIKDYVSHAELDSAVQKNMAQLEEAKVQEERALQEKRNEELRRERFFNRSGRER